MLSFRLQTILSMVDNDAKVIDIGTDHAFVPIYLYKNGITSSVVASDISEKVVASARENVKKNGLEGKISVVVSDGFAQIDAEFDLAIIAGMGTNTIKKIVSGDKLPKTLILESHTDLDELRIFMNQLGYRIVCEKVVFEHKKYYSIMKYVKGKEVLTKEEVLFGKSNNIEYYHYLLDKYKKLYSCSKKEELLEHIAIGEKIIEKIQDLQ